MFDSYAGPVFNSFGIEGDDVHTLTLTSVGATAQEWISLLEVSGLRRINHSARQIETHPGSY